jgi:hypothetical protein
MRNLSNCKITTFRLNSALLTALFSMRREIKGDVGKGLPQRGTSVSAMR